MQNAPMNKNLMIALIVVVALGAIYGAIMLFSGGGISTGDMPANMTATPPAATTPAATTPPPSTSTPPAGAPAGTPEQGQQGPAGPSIGGPAPGGAPGGPGAGAPAPPGAGGGTPTPPPSTGGTGATPPAGGAAPSTPSPIANMTEKQKTDAMKAFEKVDSHDIMMKRQEEAKDTETKLEPDKDLPYPDTGRTDPLFIVSEAVPEELRPPRSGETDYDSILDFLITAYGTELLDSVQIEVWSVMQIGMEKYVNMSIDGMLATVPEGRGGTLPNGVSITVASASQDEVIISLSFSTPYSSVSKSKSYIPKD